MEKNFIKKRFKQVSEDLELFLSIPEINEVCTVIAFASLISGFVGLYTGMVEQNMHPLLLFLETIIFIGWSAITIHYRKNRGIKFKEFWSLLEYEKLMVEKGFTFTPQ